MKPDQVHYLWHSNPKSRPLWLTLFNKCVVRPKVNTAWEVVKSDRATEGQKEDAWKVIKKLDQNYNQSASSVMEAGKSVQYGCDQHFLENCPSKKAIYMATSNFMNYQPRTWDNGSDSVKTALVKDEIEQVTEHAILGLKEAFQLENRVVGEKEYLEPIKGCELKYNTRPDYCHRVDLKTKWSSPAETKSGKKASYIPKNLSGMFDMKNVYQAAGFKMVTNRDPVLVYATAKDYFVFNKDNCDELKPDFLDDVIQDIIRLCRSVEIKINLAPNLMTLLACEPPNIKDLLFPEPPGIMEEIENLLGQIEYTKSISAYERIQDEFTKRPS